MALATRATVLESITGFLELDQLILITNIGVWLLVLASGVFVGLRLFVVYYKKLALVIDDAFLAAAWSVLVVNATATSLILALGTTTPAASSLTTPSAPLLLANVARTAILTASAWSKSAVAFSLLGASNGSRVARIARIGLIVLVVLVNLVAAGGIAATWLRCQPIIRAWVPGVAGTCWPAGTVGAIGLGVFAFFALADLFLVVVGSLLVWSNDTGFVDKVGVVILAVLGVAASASAVITALEAFTPPPDPGASATSSNITTSLTPASIRPLLAGPVDPALTILAAALPALRLLFFKTASDTASRAGDSSRFASLKRTDTTDSEAPLTPLDGVLRPQRPPRPASNASYTTLSTKVGGGGAAFMGGSAVELETGSRAGVASNDILLQDSNALAAAAGSTHYKPGLVGSRGFGPAQKVQQQPFQRFPQQSLQQSTIDNQYDDYNNSAMQQSQQQDNYYNPAPSRNGSNSSQRTQYAPRPLQLRQQQQQQPTQYAPEPSPYQQYAPEPSIYQQNNAPAPAPYQRNAPQQEQEQEQEQEQDIYSDIYSAYDDPEPEPDPYQEPATNSTSRGGGGYGGFGDGPLSPAPLRSARRLAPLKEERPPSVTAPAAAPATIGGFFARRNNPTVPPPAPASAPAPAPAPAPVGEELEYDTRTGNVGGGGAAAGGGYFAQLSAIRGYALPNPFAGFSK